MNTKDSYKTQVDLLEMLWSYPKWRNQELLDPKGSFTALSWRDTVSQDWKP